MPYKTEPGKMVVQNGVEVHTDTHGRLSVKVGEQNLEVGADQVSTLYSLLGDVVSWDDGKDA